MAVTAGMMGEALALATKGGIGWEAILEVIGESAVGSPRAEEDSSAWRQNADPDATAAGIVQAACLGMLIASGGPWRKSFTASASPAPTAA